MQWGLVPQGCLLGGRVLSPILSLKKDPCKTCPGPRVRCGGRSPSTLEERIQDLNEGRIRSILLGTDESVIDQLLKRH